MNRTKIPQAKASSGLPLPGASVSTRASAPLMNTWRGGRPEAAAYFNVWVAELIARGTSKTTRAGKQ